MFLTTTIRPGELFEFIRDELAAHESDQTDGRYPVATAVQAVNVEEAFSLYVLFAACPENQECPDLPIFHIWDP